MLKTTSFQTAASAVTLFVSLAVSPVVSASDTPEQGQADARKFTSERVFDLEYADSPQVSPDGKTIIYARKSMNKFTDRVVSNLWQINASNGVNRPLITGKRSVSSARWSPTGDRIVYLTSVDGKPSLRVRYMDSGESFAIAQLERSPAAPVWSPDGKHIAFSMSVPTPRTTFTKPLAAPKGATWAKPVNVYDDLVFRRDGAGYLEKGVRHVFTVSAGGGTPRQVTHGDNGFTAPSWLSNSALVVQGNDVDHANLDPIESELYKVNLDDLTRTALTTRDGPDYSPKVSPNRRTIAFGGYDDKLKAYQQRDLYLMDTDGSNIRNLTDEYDRSIGNFQWSSDGKSLLAQVGVDGEVSVVSFSVSGDIETIVKDVGGTSLGRPYASGSFSSSNGVLAYTQASAVKPADIAINRGGRSRTLTDLNSDVLKHLDIAPIEEIKVKSRHDQREIEAWVALPKGFKDDGSFPLILEIHGGPFSMYGPNFSAEIQRYAAEGYVTVYVNPRGSTGYGEEFAQLIDKAYPGFDHEDLMTVVDELVKRNYVDDKRLFITGGSGGGVLSAWAIGKTKRFVAAATIKPVINWTSMALSADIGAFVSRHWMGMPPWENQEFYWSKSPLSLVGNVTTPTMVMVGEEDWRTPAWESEQFYSALKLQKVDTVLVTVPGASHSIASRPSNLIAKVDNIMGWFALYDPAKAASAENVP
ncbi:MAG: prolyl oligopeptidase family serine peptidase [Gammaproteobacteria bacterium]